MASICSSLFLAFFILFLNICCYVESAPVDGKVKGLYDVGDNVTIITGENFNKTVFNSPTIWMVEFYSSWCGHCQTFAPTFKSFAKDVSEWQQVYRVAVMNCPDEINRQICRDMNIEGYPTMRVFPPFSSTEEPGIKINERAVAKLRNASLEFIQKYIDKIGWDLTSVPKPIFEFITYKEILEFHVNQDSLHYLALVIEEESSQMGKEILLDMSSCRNISTRRFNANSPELKKVEEYTGNQISNFPIVLILPKGGEVKEIDVKLKRRSFYTYKLRELPGVGDPKPLPKQEIIETKSEGIVDWTKVDRGKVYMADIESGLRYALTVEVASVKELSGEDLDALKNFVGTLAMLSEHIPVSLPTKNFLVRLTGWLASHETIDHQTWQKRVEVIEPNSFLPALDQRWVGCAPSKPGLRGYPCSLWTLFHAMTVAGYNKNEADVQAVPRAMEYYISNFFTCMECRKNFVRELIENPYDDRIHFNKDAVLWLWELHNKVNKRLHGAVSEDPNIPKVQYPPAELCSDCQDSSGKWNKDAVFMYLTKRYSSENVLKDFMDKSKFTIKEIQPVNKDPEFGKDPFDVRDFGQDFDSNFEVNAKLEDIDFDGAYKNYELSKNKKFGHGGRNLIEELRKDRTKDHSVHVMKHMGSKEFNRQVSRLEREWQNPNHSPSLTFFDTSMCVVLWGSSIVAVGLMYMYMRHRSTLRKCKL